MERITARSNDKIKYACALSKSASKRRENGEFLLEGARLCSDAAISDIAISSAFFTPNALKNYSDYLTLIVNKADVCFEITDDLSAKMSDTGSSQGVFCVCRIKNSEKTALDYGKKYLALENVQDPANLGAVCRTAEALGVGLIVSGGCDIYNPKALRAAMGSSLRLDILECESLPDLINEANCHSMLTLASTPSEKALNIAGVNMNGGVICCVGNEGNGLTEQTMQACSERVTIPMAGRAESLNASAAAAILMWCMAGGNGSD